MINIIFCLLFFIIIGCGPNGTLDQKNTIQTESNTSANSFPIVIERAPVFRATVLDATGTQASNNNLGFSNIYTFNTKPTYPISVSGGYMDINHNGILDNNDTKLDINMSSYSNIISPLTTLIGNDSSLLNKLAEYYDINKTKVTTTVPSKSSKNIILLTNIAYKALRNNYKIGSQEFNQTVNEIETLYQENFRNITSLELLASSLEEKVISQLTNVQRLSSQEVDTLSGITSINENNISFTKTYENNNSIQDIWNLIIKIPKNQNIEQFDIGVHILKDEPQTIGDILIKGISLKNNKIQNINSINVFGKKISGSTGSIGYSSIHEITKNAVTIIQNEFLLVKLGYIMENQTIVSQESFKRIASYTVELYASKLNMNTSISNNDYQIQLNFNDFLIIPKGSQHISGLIKIKESNK